METLDLRAHRQSEAAIEVGRFLEGRVPRVLHPGLPSHPQHALAMKQMDATGPIFAFEVEGRAQAHGLLDALPLLGRAPCQDSVGPCVSLSVVPLSLNKKTKTKIPQPT